jgi:lysozyme
MLQSTIAINPNLVFSRPWQWDEIPPEKAVVCCAFVPIVAVYRTGLSQRAEVLRTTSKGTYDRLDTRPRFYIQVGSAKSTAAKSPVPWTMNLSTKGAEFIEAWEQLEGYNSKAQLYLPYDDGYGYLTIGYGHLLSPGEDVSKGLTRAQVDQLFIADSSRFVKGNNKLLKVGVSQNQFDALVSLSFNTGIFNSLAIQHLNRGRSVAKSDFTAYDHVTVKGKKIVSSGLLKRRNAEWVIFSKNIYDTSH